MEARSAESWRVDSYQVPVPLGDCSLHFSVVSEAGVLKIDTAIIVDGGKGEDANGKSAKEIIEDTVNKLTPKYEEFPGFHYWLVSHWDDDHYHGALYYLLERKQKQEKQVEVFGPVSWDDKVLGMSSGTHQDNMRKLVEKKCKTYKIGQDFFEDDKVFEFSGDIDFVTWSRALAKNEKANPKKPMFLCVAAAGDCFNNPNKDRLIDHGIKSPDQKNATSAFFIIAWPGSPNICYYAAGDGNVEIEKHFQKTKFLETNSDNGALVLKGTHHGAFNAFNAELFGQMKPRNYVVSAGNQFGHPTAALLVSFAIHKLAQPEGDKFTLYTSRYPYWLAGNPEDNSKMDLNVEHIKKLLNTPKANNKMFDSIKALVEKSEQVDAKQLVKALEPIWKFLARSEPPSNMEEEDRSYRVHMRFKRAAMDKSEVKISVYASDEDDDWNK